MSVNFYDAEKIADELLKFVVIVARYKNQWVFCKHRERNTWETPGGHREPNEKIVDTAKRELYEETGAVDFSLQQICVYSVYIDNANSYGMLYFAEITEFDKLPNFEIEKIQFCDEIPSQLTYPLILPSLIEKVKCTILDKSLE